MMGGPLPPKRPRAAHAGLVDLLGYNFHEPKLLEQALTHPSLQAGNGSAGRGPYERLEFLGDRVLGLVVAEMLYNRFPGENEGALARRHAALVRRESLARIAQQINLGPALSLSRSEEETGGRNNMGTLADACEAVMAAPPKDAKTALQEWAQARALGLPVYSTLAVEGPPHNPDFLIGVEIDGTAKASGRGPSKRTAEQAAATNLLEQLNK